MDLRSSAAWLEGHVPGSRWLIRPGLAAPLAGGPQHVTLVADDPRLAAWAVADLAEAGRHAFAVLDGGLAAWRAQGEAVHRAPDALAPAERIDFLFFVHDRHTGNKAASREYLAWELGTRTTG
ncbi:rhodanese-like domain-containing protein [Paraburkholderia silvatlantica]|uniref:rhodanese-like domain-containing protein n=1 Tax=Paraburkholderia silvatlantica TaxID=321895 RepID=UPI001FCA8746|nr:rhodanese-like domain-containing protein [Paraburkholderia silvatlantica]